MQSEYDAKNAVILGVSFDKPKANKRFAKLFSFEFKLLSDTDRSMALAYGATKEGARGGASRIGVVIDPEGKVLKHYGKVSPADFPGQALADIP